MRLRVGSGAPVVSRIVVSMFMVLFVRSPTGSSSLVWSGYRDRLAIQSR